MSTFSIGSTRAILLCLNSIIGAGIFVNIKSLFSVAGTTSPLVYLFCAAILFPILWTMLTQASLRPVAAGLFAHTQEAFGPMAAFASTWAYFLSKATSAAIMVSFFLQVATEVPLAFPMDVISKALIITVIILLNIFGLKLGGRVQYLFTLVKGIAFFSIVFAGLYFLDVSKLVLLVSKRLPAGELLHAIPVAIYSLTGFEILVTLAHQIREPFKIRRFGICAFLMAVLCCFLVQSCAIIIAGSSLTLANDSISALAVALVSISVLLFQLTGLAIKTSALSSAFSILSNNCWNLRAVSSFLPFGQYLLPVNSHNVPYRSLIAEGVLAFLVSTLSSDLASLQCMFAFSTSCAFLAVCLSAGVQAPHALERTLWDKILQKVSVFSCLYLMYKSLICICATGFSGAYFFVFFGGLLLALLARLF